VPTLLDLCQDLKGRAEASSQDARAAEEFSRYQRSADGLAHSLSALHSSNDLASAVRNAEIATLPADEDCAYALHVAKTIRDRVNDARGHELEQLATEVELAVSNLVVNVNHRLTSELDRWSERQPSPSEHVLDVLANIAPSQADRTRKAVITFQRLVDSRPSTPEAIVELAESASELGIAYQELASAAPAEVSEFLERAPGGVPLDEVSPEVLDWLRDNDAASDFLVRTRR
jgi:hypothetical protein